MRALLYNRPLQTLETSSSWPVPQPRFEDDEHLLEVSAYAITKGELQWPLPPDVYQDYSPGVEMSGTVVASPAGSKFPPGTEVYMRTTTPRSGSAREYAIGLGKELARKPHTLTHDEAAAVPVSALTAWQALFVQAGFKEPTTGDAPTPESQEQKRILIVGASGSVGLWTTQLARLAGFWVVGTCQTKNISLVQDFGAQEVIDYTKTSIAQWSDAKGDKQKPKFDLVLDCVHANSTEAWQAAHSEHGLVLSIVAPDDFGWKWTLNRPEGISTGVNGRFFIMDSDGGQLGKITSLIDAGKLRHKADNVFEFDEFRKAFDRVDSGQTTGKVVVKV